MAKHSHDPSAYGKNTNKAGWRNKVTTPMDSKSGAKPGSRLLGWLLRKGGTK